ncbi:MAG: FkbM family methyltransferase [Microcoleaceae cyanobacterium]
MIKSFQRNAVSLLAETVQWLSQSKSQPKTQKTQTSKAKVMKDPVVTWSQGLGTGLKFCPDKSNPDFAKGIYELPLQKAFASYLQPGHVFYDIGANIGFFTVLAAQLVGKSGSVYAFEPVPENAERVRYNAKLNQFSNVTVYQKAVSANTGEGNLLLAHHSGGATLSTVGTPPDLRGSMQVELVCIDELVAKKKIKPPTAVKVDVEGAEIEVLKGMLKTIDQYKPIIFYEVDDGNKESFQQKSDALESFIRKLGYKIITLEDAYPTVAWNVGHAIAIPE